MIRRLAIACCMLLCPAALAAQGVPHLEPGSWRIVVRATTNGKADPGAGQDEEVCLRAEELEDLAKYFAPALEGVQASCTTTRRPTGDRAVISHRLRCKGKGFTYEAESVVTIASPRRFLVSMRSDAKTPRESAVVVGTGEATRTGSCTKP